MNELEITSLILLIIGLPLLFGSIIGYGFAKIFQNEIFKKIDNYIQKKIENFIISFLFFVALYIFIFPIFFILMVRYWLSNKNTEKMTGKEGYYLIGVHFPLLLIWFSGWIYFVNIMIKN